MIIIITIKQKQRNEIEGPNQKEEIKKKSHCSANKKPLKE